MPSRQKETELEKENKRKYLKPPTVSQVLDFIKELDVKYSNFELFYGIPEGTIKDVKGGFRNIPVRHWHIFYEKIVPKYGVGFDKVKNNVTRKVHKKVSKGMEYNNNLDRLLTL